MQTAYIYSVSRVQALATELLSSADIDRLLVEQPGKSLREALKETYLAPYLLDASDENVAAAIEATLVDTRVLLESIAPHPHILNPIWMQYDIHNLRVLTKAQAAGLNFADVAELLSSRGVYSTDALYTAFASESLNLLQPGWQDTVNDARRNLENNAPEKIDALFDRCYLRTALQHSNDVFVAQHVKLLIDFYNLKGQLRSLQHPDVFGTFSVVSGGTLAEAQLETIESINDAFASFGGRAHWETALATFEQTKNSTELDARTDEFISSHARQSAYDMFSSASLVFYYLLTRQAAANIRTIIVSKDSGMSEAAIRPNLRLAYVRA